MSDPRLLRRCSCFARAARALCTRFRAMSVDWAPDHCVPLKIPVPSRSAINLSCSQLIHTSFFNSRFTSHTSASSPSRRATVNTRSREAICCICKSMSSSTVSPSGISRLCPSTSGSGQSLRCWARAVANDVMW
ncbi:hypothetical protein CC85DRAFT_162936 [Cutaneotrichosporon oleaginosum]|uniref:Uncharacterized protein n=1 Tax=Cutaneotrichosporon oleaginosum TaxID=879819 RepID=A0A0J0XGD3_9TREE|nr:uncharacterized protein CC85DRAFT_162936 [Cutaneotrichosporon oleaginosum]KLT40123.1 hypothetical protein CC85DRAFT_162936 [Cutaneotrichosporon oleaginosum]TXT04760.1 hypothetical protein COLE_07579 [Cutaneotrichosporon oleaginosum]